MENNNTNINHQKINKNWRRDGSDLILDLGIMKKAIIVRRFTKDGLFSGSNISKENVLYGIGQASYFPFTHDQYIARFNNPHDACLLAENHIKDWFNSIIINNKSDNENNQLNESNKQIKG